MNRQAQRTSVSEHYVKMAIKRESRKADTTQNTLDVILAATKRGPVYVPNHGTPMKRSHRNNMLRFIMLNKPNMLRDNVQFVRMVHFGQASRTQVMGFHPTKGGRHVTKVR